MRFHLNEAWPDFMTFFGTPASGAGLVLPKKYISEVGDDGFKKHPIGAGPYKFVSNKPGIEVVLEANTDYWRKVPNVKTLVMRSAPEATTRALMVRTGEADISITLDGPDAEGLQKDRSPDRPLEARLDFLDRVPKQWDPKSPWHDKRVRDAVNYALNRAAINQVACLGFCPPAGVIVPRVMDYALQTEPTPYDPAEGKAAFGRGRLSEGLRRRRVRRDPRFPDRRRGGRQRP